MIKIAIIHYLPLEYYPPVTNLMDTLAGTHPKKIESIKVYSCHDVKGREKYQPHSTEKSTKCIAIRRSPFPRDTDNALIRLYKYIHFNLFTLVGLLLQRPTSILYFESYSAWPTYIYSRFFNRKCRIFIHNHEYADKGWYATTMHQVRYFHRLEKKWLYPRAVWNSQTNSDRLQFFHNDHPTLRPETLRIMPNYPPRSWKFQIETVSPGTPKLHKPNILKIVYVGSLSFHNTYLKEFCNWVIQQNGRVQFDIYAYNLYNNVKEYLNNLGSPNINYFDDGLEYNNIPMVISNYDVGIIFYKAYSQNVINCISNKFYEYFACGLDVWFSAVMKSTHRHATDNTYPKLIPVDFEDLHQFDWQVAINKKGMTQKPSEYFCEDAFQPLIKELFAEQLNRK